jgi:hypothetical protein
MNLTFQRTGDGDLEIVDPIERRQYTLRTDEPPSPRRADTDEFVFPVDDAVRFEASEVVLPSLLGVYVRSASGEMLSQIDPFSQESFPAGTYSVEICAPMKLYLRVDGPFTASADLDSITFTFESADLLLGGRSRHDHPEATITVTDDPADLMEAVSYLGSALKTTSCERSYPTLRGHPPLLEFGDHLDVPASLEKPDTGVRIEIPPSLRYVFVAAPLAYYLGATVDVGNVPRIVTESGFEHPLETTRGFEAEVERVLKQVFFFDCVTRTEGYYRVDLHERSRVEPLVDMDFADLYDRSIPEQLERYLAVPFEVIEEFVPEWKLTTHVQPTADNVETLPFVVNDLAVVKSPRTQAISRSDAEVAAIDEFMRDGEFTRSAAGPEPATPSFIEPERTDSLEQAWIGDDAPLNASKATTDAFRNRLEREARAGDIEIAVVCNDPEMDEEQAIVDDVYGSREDLPFDIDVHHELTIDELRDVLTTPVEFLHYIGHIDSEGFQCSDGKLDAESLEDIAIDAFLLNACQSYTQGMALIEAGSVGGIATLSDVINSGAVTMGCNIARLLNRGFPLRAALNVARDESIIGGQYIVVGDGNIDIAQAESGNAVMCEIETDGTDYTLSFKTFPTSTQGMGSVTVPNISATDEHFLSSGELTTFELTREELVDFLQLEDCPVRLNGRFSWSQNIAADDL